MSTEIGDSAEDENLAIMADLSNSSDMMALEGLPEELLKKTLRPHCYRVTEQGIIMLKISVINELRMYDLPKHSKSIASAMSGFLNFVDDQINRNKSVDPISVIQKSVIQKPTNNPCKYLPTCDVACQDTIWLSQAEVVEPKSPSKSTETTSSTSTLGGRQNKGKDAGCIANGLTGSKTDLIGSSRVLQNKSKPKMVKPKKPEIGV